MRRLVFLAMAASQLAFSQLMPSEVPGVEVLDSTSPRYAGLVDKVLGIARPASTNGWLNYGVALTNNSPQTVIGVAVRWSTIDTEGKVVGTNVFNNLGALSTRMPQAVKPGQSVVVLPMALLSDAITANRNLSVLPNQGQLLKALSNAPGMQIALDGVVFDSGQFVGPDSQQEYEQAFRLTAEREQLASMILAKRAAGEPVGDWLKAAATPTPPGGNQTGSLPGISPAIARLFLATLQGAGEQRLYALAEGYLHPAIRLHR